MKCNNFKVTPILSVYLNKTDGIVNTGLEQRCCCQQSGVLANTCA